jgi:hypothetical protein
MVLSVLFASALGLAALSISGQSAKQESAASLTARELRIFESSPATTKPRIFPLKSHGETIAKIAIANLKGVPVDITGRKAEFGNEDNKRKMRTMSVRDGAQVELRVQDGEPIRITADEIEWSQPVSQQL